MKYNDPNDNLNNDRQDMNKFFMDIVAEMDHHRGDILSMHFWPYQCIIAKAAARPSR